MNPEVVEVFLTSETPDDDILFFSVDDKKISVNLNSQDCQASLKDVFAELLRKLIRDDVKLVLNVDEKYRRQMYIEVCQEYIKDLNRELDECKTELRKQLSNN